MNPIAASMTPHPNPPPQGGREKKRPYMRRFATLALLPLIVIGVASCSRSGSVVGGGSKPLELVSVRVGIPPGPLVVDEEAGRRTDSLFKAGHWTPVLVT